MRVSRWHLALTGGPLTMVNLLQAPFQAIQVQLALSLRIQLGPQALDSRISRVLRLGEVHG